MRGYVLVGGWPATGKTAVARGLAAELGFAYLSQDEVKEALMDALGAPASADRSRRLGVAAVHAVLRAAKGCPAAVVDSTWFPYSLPLVRALDGPFVEVRCRTELDLARARCRQRIRGDRHLDQLRTAEELWDDEVPPLGVGPVLEIDTMRPVDVGTLAGTVREALSQFRNLDA